MAMLSTSQFRTRLSKVALLVMQSLCLQHLFSASVGMIWHFLHLHQGTGLLGPLSWSMSGGWLLIKAFASSIPPKSLYASTMNLWHCSILKLSAYSCKINVTEERTTLSVIYLYNVFSRFSSSFWCRCNVLRRCLSDHMSIPIYFDENMANLVLTGISFCTALAILSAIQLSCLQVYTPLTQWFAIALHSW